MVEDPFTGISFDLALANDAKLEQLYKSGSPAIILVSQQDAKKFVQIGASGTVGSFVVDASAPVTIRKVIGVEISNISLNRDGVMNQVPTIKTEAVASDGTVFNLYIDPESTLWIAMRIQGIATIVNGVAQTGIKLTGETLINFVGKKFIIVGASNRQISEDGLKAIKHAFGIIRGGADQPKWPKIAVMVP